MNNIMEKIKENKIEAIFIIIVVAIFLILTIDFSPKEEVKEEKTVTHEKKPTKIMVDIKGAVNNPDVYEMKDDDRVIDVIKKAGGLKANANTSLINLSKKIKDEMAITIYTNEEIKASQQTCHPCECPEVNSACTTENSSKTTAKEATSKTNKDSKTVKKTNEKVSINTATLEQLKTLDGIGDAKAKAIIGYRQKNGAFKKIEEIKNVSGIGDAIYEKIKDNITI